MVKAVFRPWFLTPILPRFAGTLSPAPWILAQPLPSVSLDLPAVSLANNVIRLERDDGARGILIEVVLDQLGDEIVTIKVEKIVPEARNPVRLGDESSLGVVRIKGFLCIHVSAVPPWYRSKLGATASHDLQDSL